MRIPASVKGVPNTASAEHSPWVSHLVLLSAPGLPLDKRLWKPKGSNAKHYSHENSNQASAGFADGTGGNFLPNGLLVSTQNKAFHLPLISTAPTTSPCQTLHLISSWITSKPAHPSLQKKTELALSPDHSRSGQSTKIICLFITGIPNSVKSERESQKLAQFMNLLFPIAVDDTLGSLNPIHY